MTTIEMVREFHEKFDHPVHDTPHLTNEGLNMLRVDLLREETDELNDALCDFGNNPSDANAAQVLDALCDLQVVLDGSFLSLGFWKVKNAAFAEVHRSNMSKLGAGGKPMHREDGKILKGPDFQPPNLEQFLKPTER